ncbi:MAG: TetR/AcrR family transcriptional regulator [Anaerolineae bacterium]|nr:TetR/AcrR family transcriptional regulator [Anaerolineae bacterium]
MPTKGEQTRDKIIRRAAGIFNRSGFSGTSMSDLMRETGLEKGGLYNHFPSKEALALEAFEFARGRIARRLEPEFKRVRHAADRLIAFAQVFEALIDDAEVPGGCAVFNTAVEADDGNPVLKARAQAGMDEFTATVRRIIDKGIARGEIKPEVDSVYEATIFVALMEGALVMSRLYNDPVHVQRAIAHVRERVESALRA